MTDNSDKLIKFEIKGRQVTYYLTTEEDLNNVKSNSILRDIFTVLMSLNIGGIITVILTKATGIQLVQETINILDILRNVFIFGMVIFALFTAYFYYNSFMIINRIKSSGAVKSLKGGDGQEEIKLATEPVITGTRNESILEVIKAEYWTENVRLDVTEELRKKIVENKLETIASNDIKYDPDIGTVKRLSITYKFNGITITKEFIEGDKVLIP
jgi:hypothetical protein